MKYKQYPVETIREFTKRVCKAAKIHPSNLFHMVNYYVETSLQGIDSHGLWLLPRHINDILRNKINPQPSFKQIMDEGPCLHIDGDNGPGVIVAAYAMNKAIEHAAKYGIGITAVRGGNHFGAATYYALLAIKQQMIGIVLSNAAGRHMAHWGARTPLIANNPLAIGVPANKEEPLIIDIAMSTVARAKILRAAKEGWASIPSSWALDNYGQPTTDPEVAYKGILRPMGDHKGSGLAVVIGAICGALTGANFDHEISIESDEPRNTGHIMIALNVSQFIEYNDFCQRIDAWINLLNSAEIAEGFNKIYLPGHCEFYTRKIRLEEGIPVSDELKIELDKLAEKLKVDKLEPKS